MEIRDYEYEQLSKKASTNKLIIRITAISLIVLFALIALGLWGCPSYNVWNKEMNGKAQLSEAEYSKQIQIQEAQSNLEAEKLNAEAEVERAKGAADARNVEGLGMTPEEYVQYLWVKKLSLANASVVYIPTDSGIPTFTQDALNPPAVTNTDNPDSAAEQQ